MANILVVDDEKEIADLLEIYLCNEGYKVYKFYESKSVVENLDVINIDLAIIDIMMSDIDGFRLCEIIREKYNYPIIFVTAKFEITDKIKGLMIGADDYVTKPFLPAELMARVKANLRRSNLNKEEDKDIIEFRGININRKTHEFYFNNKLICLTKTEFNIMWYLCENRGCVVKNDELFRYVWDDAYFTKDNNTIMVHIRHLREKMGDNGRVQKYIKTIYGVGYKIEK